MIRKDTIYRVAIAGASGYAGGEVLRLLASHPNFEIGTLTAHSQAGKTIGEVHPHLRSLANLCLQDTTAENLSGHDVVVLALPHGHSGQIAAELEERHESAIIVDAGADHRLEDETDWHTFYGGDYHPFWTYGVPELVLDGGRAKQRQNLVGTKRIAAPGCNASTVALSLAPAVAADLIEVDDLVSVLAVGPSGAGKALKPHLLAAERLGSALPYSVGGTHRHIPEIIQSLAKAVGQIQTTSTNSNASTEIAKSATKADFHLSFTPVLVPMSRGILATGTATVKPGVNAKELREAYLDVYGMEKFVQILPEDTWPTTGDVVGANTALLGLTLDQRANRLTVVAAVDNLVKGTAGAVVQSLNIALDLPEDTGLTTNGVAP